MFIGNYIDSLAILCVLCAFTVYLSSVCSLIAIYPVSYTINHKDVSEATILPTFQRNPKALSTILLQRFNTVSTQQHFNLYKQHNTACQHLALYEIPYNLNTKPQTNIFSQLKNTCNAFSNAASTTNTPFSNSTTKIPQFKLFKSSFPSPLFINAICFQCLKSTCMTPIL